MITIVDYGMGNLESIKNMFKKLQVEAIITSRKEDLKRANKLILPGVGAFDRAMEQINKSGFRNVLEDKAHKECIPILGICLGMQLLTNGSEEGKLPGLGWIDADTKKFRIENAGIKVPHMGWNEVRITNPCKLTEGIEDLSLKDENPRYYFVHSYYVKAKDQDDSMLKTHYSIDFDSGIHKENIFGAQFHPEKSHKFGMKMFQNFAEL